jgi:hypothetical protein
MCLVPKVHCLPASKWIQIQLQCFYFTHSTKKIITPKSDIFFQDVNRQNSSTSCANVMPISGICMAAVLVLLIIGNRMVTSGGITFISSFLKLCKYRSY